MNMMDPRKPFNTLPLLPPEGNLETPEILKRAISAHRELGRLAGYCALLPDDAILLNAIVLKEARASSEIENIITTTDKLYRALVSNQREMEPAVKEVLSYRDAVRTGLRILENGGLITTRTILAIQKRLEKNSAGIRTLPGTTLTNDLTGEVIYTPPEGEETIRRLLKNLEEFIHEDDLIDPLIKMAIAHYQFESIHPFYDGNGRTGRILNVLYLVAEGLIPSPILYLSRYIIRRKEAYYSLLQAVRTESRWSDWIQFILTAVESTARETLDTIVAVVALMNDTAANAKRDLPKTTYSRDLVELLFRQPYTKIDHLVAAGIAERRTASKYLKQLEAAGYLESYRSWRETIYINRRLMDVLGRLD